MKSFVEYIHFVWLTTLPTSILVKCNSDNHVNLVVFSDNFNAVHVHRCEVGDLSGKFGPIMPHVDLDVVDSTGNLSLSGPLSIVGRSIVVHSSVDGSNFECGTIQLVEQTDDTGTAAPIS